MDRPVTIPLTRPTDEPSAWSGHDPPRPASPSKRHGLHAALFVATGLSLALTGGFWEGTADELTSVRDLVDPITLLHWLASGATYAVLVLLVLGSHEMGHYFACRYYGIPATLPFFIPGIPPLGSFGAVIRIRGPIPHRRALFDVAAAGPIAGFVVALPVLVVGLLRAEPFDPAPIEGGAYFELGRPLVLILLEGLGGTESIDVNSWIAAGWVGMLVTSLNLFPVGQLDGGHAAYAISRRLHRFLARGTLLALAGIVVAQLVLMRQLPAYLIWLVILGWMRDRHPRLLDESDTLGFRRRLVGVLLAVLLALTFIFAPLRIVEV